MAHGPSSSGFFGGEVSLKDGPQLDAFGRQRVSTPTYIFDAQLTYGLQPVLLEPITSGSGAILTHDATNRCALMSFSSSPAGSLSLLQSFEHFRYQPGRGQTAVLTFIFGAAVAGVRRFAGYSDGVNGIEFQQTESGGLQLVRYSATGVGNLVVPQSSWNVDKLDGTGQSGITLDVTKSQILEIDFQALYVGRVRVGFVIDGVLVEVHRFKHSNIEILPYIQSANLPVRFGMEVVSGTPTATMRAVCMSVLSEGGQIDELGEPFSATGAVTAANGVATHLFSIRPLATFNSFVNRVKFIMLDVEGLVTGTSPVRFDVVLGQAITGASWTPVNFAYSAAEVSAGTATAAPGIILGSFFVGASNQAKGVSGVRLQSKLPICLDRAGNPRALGTISILATGLGGASACNAALMWREIQ